MNAAHAMLLLALLLQTSCSPSDYQEPSTHIPKPPPSAGQSMVYHDSLGAILLLNTGLGSMNSPASSTKTIIWKWNGQAWSVLDSLGPPIRNLAGVAYDVKRNKVVMHGGEYDQNLNYDETWEWGQSTGWQKRSGTGPGRRNHLDMAYDAARQRVVLFGGQATLDSFPNETWTWDGTSWTQAATTGPVGRVHYSMVYDPTGQRVLLFGGAAPTEHASKGDTWAWNGSSWSQVATATAPRSHARIARTSSGFIVIGGLPALANGSVLSLSGSTWATASQPNAPNRRYLPALAYDPVRQVTVLFGGGDPTGGLLADTWQYSTSGGWQKAAE